MHYGADAFSFRNAERLRNRMTEAEIIPKNDLSITWNWLPELLCFLFKTGLLLSFTRSMMLHKIANILKRFLRLGEQRR